MSPIRRVMIALAILSFGIPILIAVARNVAASNFGQQGHPFGRRYVVRYYDEGRLRIYRDSFVWIEFPFDEMGALSTSLAVCFCFIVGCVELGIRIAERPSRNTIGFDVLVRQQDPAEHPAANASPHTPQQGPG